MRDRAGESLEYTETNRRPDRLCPPNTDHVRGQLGEIGPQRRAQLHLGPARFIDELERPVEGVKSLEYWGRLVGLAMLVKKSGYESYLISDKKGIAVEVVSLHGSAA